MSDIRWHMKMLCLIMGDVNLDHVVMTASSTVKLLFFPQQFINTHLGWEENFKTMQISCFTSNFFPLILMSIHQSCQQSYSWGALMVVFYFLSSFYLLIRILLQGIVVPSTPYIYLFNYLFISMNSRIFMCSFGYSSSIIIYFVA